jgi:predicted transcriptional regulator
VALIETRAIGREVHNTPWQQRLKALGLTQKEFAALTGLAENTVSRQMRGDWDMPLYVKSLICALEVIGPERLADWKAKVAREKGD